MNVRTPLQLLLVLSLVALISPDASAAIPLGGQVGDDIVSLIYDPSDGNLQLEAGTRRVTALEILSPGKYLTGPRPEWDRCPLTDCFKGPEKVFLLRPGDAAFDRLDFGPFVTPGLSAETLANDLVVTGAILSPVGAIGTVDLIYVPEPSSLSLVGLMTLFCRSMAVKRGRLFGNSNVS